MPIVTFVQPILGVALALTLLIQGYVSVRIGVMEADQLWRHDLAPIV